MAPYKKLCVMEVLLGVALASCVGDQAKASVADICSAPAVTARLIKTAGEYELKFDVENRTGAAISFEQFYFFENMLHLKATRSNDNVGLKRVIPLFSPGVSNIVLSPGGTFTQKISLNTSFPDLRQAVKDSDVLISWELRVQGEKSCFSQNIKAAMRIEKSEK